MDHKKIRAIGAGLLVLIWALLTAFSWFGPRQEISLSERRPLAQMPELTMSDLLDGSFMKDFESFSLDQFPLRDTFRSLKALFHRYGLGQRDNNDLYIAEGYAAKMEYPLNPGSVDYAIGRFNRVYEKYLSESDVFLAIIPDKGYYLAEENGYLAMDYAAMIDAFREGMPWAEYIDITGELSLEDYYRTDTHWRQEALLPAADALCSGMGVAPFREGELTCETVQRPFYGVYYGQAAMPMEPDALYLLESELLRGCTTYLGELDMKTGQGVYRKLYDGVYDLPRLEGQDLYEVYLSGPQSLLRIENPNAGSDRELIIFRDSFGSAIAPLLLKDYAAVTLIDIRYLQADMLERFAINWDADVLFLYSTLVLNNSSTMK